MYPPPLDAFAAETEYQLVTDASTLAVGDKVVIAAANANYALSTNQKSNNRGAVSVTKGTDTLTINDDVQVLTLAAGTTDGTFAFYTGSGYLYAASGSSNHLKTQDSNDDNGSWKIEIATDGVATILAQGSNTRNCMQYNTSNNGLFACYASASQNPIVLYKAVEVSGTTCEHNWEVDTDNSTSATCTEKGETVEKCTLCEDTQTSTIPATGHNYDDGVITTPPTCDKPGEKTSTCANENCPEKTKTEIIPATGNHNYVNGYCSVCNEPEPQDAKYEKVTTDLADWSGQYLIVYEADSRAFNGSLSTLDAASNNQAVTISDNTITTSEAIYFTITAVDGGYSIQSASGKYIGKTADGNGMNTSNSTAYTNTISLKDDGSVTIIGSGGAYLRYNANSGDTRFRYYKSTTYTNQKAIALYKLVEESSETPNPNPAPTLDEAIAKFESTKTFTSLKTNTTDGNVTDVSLRFGMRQLDAETYTALRNAGATFGVELTLGNKTVNREEGGTWLPEEDGNGYSFSIVIDNLAGRWNTEITAQVYVKFGETKHYMQSATYSVNSLVKALGYTINGSIIVPNAPAALMAVLNKEVA